MGKNNKPIEPTHCSFCGEALVDEQGRKVRIVEAGVDKRSLSLCERCVRKAARLMRIELAPEKKPEKAEPKKPNSNPLPKDWTLKSPRQLADYTSQFVIGQDETIRQVATLFYMHMRRLDDIYVKNLPADKIMSVPGGLLMGNSGVGKTYTIQKMSEYTGLPVAIIDTNALSQVGYVGEDPDLAIYRLIEAAGGIQKESEIDQVIARASCGVVFLDELDKCAGSLSPHSNAGHGTQVSTVAVQSALLRMIEGDRVTIYPGSSKYSGNKNRSVVVGTENILWIGAGAFTGIHELINENESMIGFRNGIKDDGNIDSSNLGSVQDYLISYGFMPELVGRLSFIVPLKNLEINDYLAIMLTSKDSHVQKAVKLFEREGINLLFEYEALERIAELCFRKCLGARTIAPLIQQDILLNVMFECFGKPEKEVEEVRVNVDGKEVVTEIKGVKNKKLSIA